jgi:hypothetical protein
MKIMQRFMLVGEAEAMDPEAGIKNSNFIWNRITVLPHCPSHRETHSHLGFGAPPSCAALCAPARGGGVGLQWNPFKSFRSQGPNRVVDGKERSRRGCRLEQP